MRLPDQSANGARAVTTSDTVNLPNGVCRGLYIGGAGNVTAVCADLGTAVLFTALPVGSILPVRVARVNATGTTATAIVALY